jgi:hypothetical protein
MHSSAVPREPFEFLAEPMYHLDVLLRSRQQREAKFANYEALRSGLIASGGGPQNLYYLPERWAGHAPSATPPEDAERIRAVLDQAPAASVPVDRGTLPVGTRASIDAHWDARPLTDQDYAATLAPLESRPRLAPAQPDTVTVRVTNLGKTTWPGGLIREPAVRLGHRWLSPDGALLDEHTPRSELPCTVAPGESVNARLTVIAPPDPGDYLLEVDLVHEDVRWFNAAARIGVHVRPRVQHA